MEGNDLTLEVLKDIRREVGNVRQGLEQTNERIDTMREELSRRIVESEVRTSTAIADLTGTVREMTQVLRAANDLRPRVEACEMDIAALKRRVGERP
jgi:methyl-accepting chemotaxis protein